VLSLTPLQTLIRLAATPNYTRVAEELNLTQPAVSQHIRALATHFGVELVDTVGRRAALTDAGRFLAERAVPLLGSVEALERDMREYAAAKIGELRVGASETIGNYALPEILASFAQRHPGVHVAVDVGNTTEMVERLRAGALTLALVEGHVAGEDLDVRAFADDELVLVVPPFHPLAVKRIVTSADLEAERFIAREAGSGTRALFEQAIRALGVAPQIVLELPSGEAVVRAVAAGMGIAVVSRLVSDDAVARGRVVVKRVAGVAFDRSFRVARLARITPSPAARAFTALLVHAHASLSA
jgi:DNA-binding transcriptional LysR family regulator